MKNAKHWGATDVEWQRFIDLGLSADLLPVVSNPGAPIAAKSTMKQTGKTPSRYNGDGEVVGIAKWTERRASEKEIALWRKEPDYGICIQTRHLRALDIDVEDPEKSKAICDYILEFFGCAFPVRYRDGSGKCLLAFFMEGEIGKRTLKVDGGIVEFLANGQQFVAAGTHSSGARYQWRFDPLIGAGAVNYLSPSITLDQFEDFWFCFEPDLGTAASTERGLRKARSESAKDIDDPTLNFLEENNHVIEYGPDGQAHIECPFAGEHTTESAVSSTSYFPKGTRGYERGHFVCLHAHCEARSDEEFLDAFGVRASEFELIPVGDEAGDDGEPELPPWERDKHGRPLATIDNVCMALEAQHVSRLRICYDSFRDELIFYGNSKWERENDNRLIKIRRMLERVYNFKPIGRELVRDAVFTVAKDNEIDTAMEWLGSLEWDGQERVSSFVAQYLGGDDTDYTRAVSEYIWTAAAGRIVTPGVKADMIPIMKGPQGYRKSTAISLMAPTFDEFVEIDFDEDDDDLARKMRGALVCEIPELRGLRTRAIEAIKAFVARTHEKWIPKYKEFSTTFPRRCVFIATTNDDEFLADSTGNRRWLPFEVRRHTDTEGITRDRAQLWAEARELYMKNGVMWQDAEALAAPQHEQYMMRDAWFDVIADWLDRPESDLDDALGTPADREYLRIIDVAREALNVDPRQLKRIDEMKIADTLKALGYEKKRSWVGTGKKKHKIRAWFPVGSDLA